jgi:hypothetical protein
MAVPVKKTRKPAASVKYLLSGDRKLQRLSLKKIPDPASKSKPRAARTTRVKQAIDEQPAAVSPKRIVERLAFVGVACVFAAAALLAARQPAPPPDDASNSAPPEVASSPQPPPLNAGHGSRGSQKPAQMGSSRPAVASRQPAPAAIVKEPTPTPIEKTQAARAAASSAAGPESTAALKNPATHTVEGCLESDGATYRLTDTSGLDAPKVRSWRTGFLKKRPSSIGFVDATGRLRVQDHIGTRVAATGTLVDRELRATALRQVGASCR